MLTKDFNVSSIGYFGSYSKQRQRHISDLDLMVRFSVPVGWDFFTLEEYLEKSIGIRVDLVTKKSLKDRIKETILNDVNYI